jgi:hypothetical protein
MSKNAINEYTAMRNAIQNNIDAIRGLIVQADELMQTISTVTDPTLKAKLTGQVESLNGSIDHLVDETDKLFKQYIDLANSVVIV